MHAKWAGLGRLRRRPVWAALAAAGGLAAAAGVAYAGATDNMYLTWNFQATCVDGGHFCQTDNAGLYVHRANSLTDAGKAVIRDTLTNSYDQTSLAVHYDPSAVYTGSGETDIIYEANASRVPSGEDGFTWCDDAVSYYQCDQHYVAFRSSTPYVELACHETGHSVGLTHGAQASPILSNQDSRLGCMTTHPISSRWLNTTNRDEINATY